MSSNSNTGLPLIEVLGEGLGDDMSSSDTSHLESVLENENNSSDLSDKSNDSNKTQWRSIISINPFPDCPSCKPTAEQLKAL